jgi:hypothetical protein
MDWHLMIMQRIERMATTPTVDGTKSINRRLSTGRPTGQKRSRRSLLKHTNLLDSIVL